VSIADSGQIIHLPFTDRPQYADPHPEGIAVGHIDSTGDASGGTLTQTFLADGGFLYRLELLQATRDSDTSSEMNYITSHQWATDRSGLGVGAFNLNWVMENHRDAQGAFVQWAPRLVDLTMIRRVPLGRTDDVLQQILLSAAASNQDTSIYDLDVVLTYWRKESLSRPGFLASFWESPFVPSPR